MLARVSADVSAMRTENADRSQHRPYVLVVDDDLLYATAIMHQLEAAGLHGRMALDAVTAIAEIDGERPDLILLDLNMPGLDGLDLCRHIKDSRSDLQIPIIVLTALSGEKIRSRALALGADGFATKPVAPQALLAMIRERIAIPAGAA